MAYKLHMILTEFVLESLEKRLTRIWFGKIRDDLPI